MPYDQVGVALDHCERPVPKYVSNLEQQRALSREHGCRGMTQVVEVKVLDSRTP